MNTVIYEKRKHKVFTYEFLGMNFNVILVPQTYRNNGTLAVEMLTVEDGRVTEPFTVATVNICHPLQSDTTAFVDTNNCGDEILDFLKSNRLAKDTGITGTSGFCTYPLYKFNTDKFFEK